MDDPEDERAAPELADAIAFRLLAAANHLAQPFKKELGRAAGVSLTEWRCLLALAIAPGQSGREVAERLGFERMTASRTLRTLEGRDLVRRRADPTNRKRDRWSLTGHGWDIVERIAPFARARDAALFGHVGTADRASLDRILREIASP